MKLSIVIPLFNEENIVDELCKRLILSLKKDFKNFKYEILLVDDGSTDSTFNRLKKLHLKNKNLKIIKFSRNFGHHLALTAGLDFANGDYIIMMDGDLQDQPEEIIKLYKRLKQGFDIVFAVSDNKNVGFSRIIVSKIFDVVLTQIFTKEFKIQGRVFRIFTKEVNMYMKQMREQNRYIPGIMSWTGFKYASQKVTREKRFQGESKYNFTKQLSLASDAIFSFSVLPLKLIFKLSAILFFFSASILLFMIYSIFVGREFQVIDFLLLFIFLSASIQTFAIAIIGEYMGRNYIEVKQRPLYVIRETLI